MNGFFKKSLMSTALILMSAGAMAAQETASFMWTGVYGTSNMTDFCINISDNIGDKLDHKSGTLTFVANDDNGDKANIATASNLGFTVVARDKDNNSCTGAQIPFTYTLNKIDIAIYEEDGLIERMVSDAELWEMKHSQEPLAGGTSATGLDLKMNIVNSMVNGGDVALTVEGTALDVRDGDTVHFQAFILVNNEVTTDVTTG